MGERRPDVGGSVAARTHGREAALQARWAAGEWRGRTLRATTGEVYQVIYQGRPGGGAGPDFRDAVLLKLDMAPNGETGQRVYGDIELHLRPSGWQAHGHASDPRYNGLALHIALDAGRRQKDDAQPKPTTLANGRSAPLVILRPAQTSRPSKTPSQGRQFHSIPYNLLTTPRWPCADLPTRLSPAARQSLLLSAGNARFAQRVAHFAAALCATRPTYPTLQWPTAPKGINTTSATSPSSPSSPTAITVTGPVVPPAQPVALSNLWPNRRLASPSSAILSGVTAQLAPVHSAPQTASPTGHHERAPVNFLSPGTGEGPGVGSAWSAADHILWLALAEALGYGRDRAALRAWGARLAPDDQFERAESIPRLSAIAPAELPRVERLRLRGLVAWRERWATSGPWAPIRRSLMAPNENSRPTATHSIGASVREEETDGVSGMSRKDAGRAARRLLAALRAPGGAVSMGRAVILAANVALPFAAAWARVTGDTALADVARRVYAALPGAPSNQITREMARQLGLPRAPNGAAAQQGLHHLWATHCREKRCDSCPCRGAPSSRHTIIEAPCESGSATSEGLAAPALPSGDEKRRWQARQDWLYLRRQEHDRS